MGLFGQNVTVERRPNPRLGVAVVLTDSAGRLLLGRRGKEPNYGRWVMPGGGIEAGESWQTTAKREVLEETGLLVHIEAQRPYVLEILSGTEHRVILCVAAEVVGGTLEAQSDLLEARFFSRGELPQELSPAVLPALVEFGWLPAASVSASAIDNRCRAEP